MVALWDLATPHSVAALCLLQTSSCASSPERQCVISHSGGLEGSLEAEGPSRSMLLLPLPPVPQCPTFQHTVNGFGDRSCRLERLESGKIWEDDKVFEPPEVMF